MISFHHPLESGCIIKNLISDALELVSSNSKPSTRVCFLWVTTSNSEHIECVFCESLHQTVNLVLGCVSLWVTTPNSEPSTRVYFLQIIARFSYPGSNGPPSSLLYCLHICEHSSPVSLHNTTSTNEFLDWGWWWWLPRSITVEPARSRVQQQFSSLRQERFQIHAWC